jgi:hypothetical protein
VVLGSLLRVATMSELAKALFGIEQTIAGNNSKVHHKAGRAMTRKFVILPSMPVDVSHNGAKFRSHTTRQPLSFDGPVEANPHELTFSKGLWLVRARRQNVILMYLNESEGTVCAMSGGQMAPTLDVGY